MAIGETSRLQYSCLRRLLQCRMLPPEWFDPPIVRSLVYVATSFFVYAECFSHAIIAANRFTVIALDERWSWVRRP